jgi:hypothetical protein
MKGSMTRRIRMLTLALSVMSFAAGSTAQVGHPVKGSWSGYWGSSAATKRRILLLLDWRDRAIVGTVNPGPNQVPIDSATLDVDTWTLTLRAALPDPSDNKQSFVATGKLTNLGSWTNRTYSGTYEYGAERGKFTVTLN